MYFHVNPCFFMPKWCGNREREKSLIYSDQKDNQTYVRLKNVKKGEYPIRMILKEIIFLMREMILF